jgi:hypothetical protein
MKDLNVLKEKIHKLCREYSSLKSDNEKKTKEEAKLREKLELLEEQSASIKKIIHQNEVLAREKQEAVQRLKELMQKIEKAL